MHEVNNPHLFTNTCISDPLWHSDRLLIMTADDRRGAVYLSTSCKAEHGKRAPYGYLPHPRPTPIFIVHRDAEAGSLICECSGPALSVYRPYGIMKVMVAAAATIPSHRDACWCRHMAQWADGKIWYGWPLYLIAPIAEHREDLPAGPDKVRFMSPTSLFGKA